MVENPPAVVGNGSISMSAHPWFYLDLFLDLI